MPAKADVTQIQFPELPDDMQDAFDSLRLAIMHAQRDGYQHVTKYDVLTMLGMLCDLAIFGGREKTDLTDNADQPPGNAAEVGEGTRPLFVAAPEEVQRCALFASDVFSEEVDSMSEVEKVDLANKVIQRWVDNTPDAAVEGGAVAELLKAVQSLDTDLCWIRHELRTTTKDQRDGEWRDGAVRMLEVHSELGCEMWTKYRTQSASQPTTSHAVAAGDEVGR